MYSIIKGKTGGVNLSDLSRHFLKYGCKFKTNGHSTDGIANRTNLPAEIVILDHLDLSKSKNLQGLCS